eukprot:s3216_g5.t2
MNGPGPRDVAVRLQVSDLRARSSDVDPADRRCLDFVAYGATPLGEALCCDVTLVSPLTRDGRPQPSATTRDGAMISVAERRKRAAYHELCARGSSAYASARAKLADAGVLNRSALSRNSCGFALLLPCAVQLPRVGCAAAWWCLLSVALHSTLAATLLGTPYIAGAMPGSQLPAVGDVLHDAVPRHPEPPGPVVCSVQGDPDSLAQAYKMRGKKKLPQVVLALAFNGIKRGSQRTRVELQSMWQETVGRSFPHAAANFASAGMLRNDTATPIIAVWPVYYGGSPGAMMQELHLIRLWSEQSHHSTKSPGVASASLVVMDVVSLKCQGQWSRAAKALGGPEVLSTSSCTQSIAAVHTASAEAPLPLLLVGRADVSLQVDDASFLASMSQAWRDLALHLPAAASPQPVAMAAFGSWVENQVAVLCCSYCGCFRTRNQGSWWPALQLLWAEAGALIACEYGTSTESCLWATIARSTAELRPWEDFVGSDSTSLMSATMLLGWLAQEQVVFCEDWEDEETGATKCACGPPVPADGSKSDLLNGRLMPGAPTAARKLLHLVAEIILAGDAANMQKLYTAVMANEDWQVLYSCTSQASSPQRYLILDRGNMELPANARQPQAETLEPIAADELFESFEDRSYLSQSDVPVKRLNVTARVFPFVANQLNSSYVMGRNRAPSCWIASQADLNSGLLERVVQALHNPRSKQPHPKLLDLSVGSATADRRKATVTDCNRSISASSIGESWKSRCAPFDFRAMLDIITILSAAGLQQELKSVNGDKSLVIHEDLRIENCRRNPDLTASPRAQAEEETSFVESAAGHVSTALETFDDAVAQGWSALFGNSESSAEMQPQPKKEIRPPVVGQPSEARETGDLLFGHDGAVCVLCYKSSMEPGNSISSCTWKESLGPLPSPAPGPPGWQSPSAFHPAASL